MKTDLFAFSSENGGAGGGSGKDSNANSVSGTISVSGGGSPEDALVELIDSEGDVAADAEVGSTGVYSFSGMPNGIYYVRASLAGYSTGTTDPFTVYDATITGKNIVLEKGNSVSGTISVSDSGSPSGATVELVDSSGVVAATTTADSSGNYTLSGISNGTYTVRASLSGYSTGETASFGVHDANITSKNLTLVRNITGLTLTAALDEVKKLGSGEFLITLGKNEADVANYDASGFSTPVIITIDGGGIYTVGWASGTASATGCLTLSDANLTIALKDVTFTGQIASNKTQPLVWIRSGATFKMQAGAVLTGNGASNGGAVYVAGGAVFEMEGGEISGNQSSGYGHGVFLSTNGVMLMSGGLISKNTLKTNSDLINGVCAYGAGASLTMSAAARIDRVWLFDSSTVITIKDAFSDTDTVAVVDIRSPSSGRQVLQAASGFTGLADAAKRFALGYSKSSPTSDGSLMTYTLGADGKLA